MKKVSRTHSENYYDSNGRLIQRIKCSTTNCPNYFSYRKDMKDRGTGKCRQCVKRGLPYLTSWKRLFHDWRKLEVTITYEQYLEFTEIPECHYCKVLIPWSPFKSDTKGCNAYYLDRKDNSKGYAVDNCVVCCTRCNRMRSNKFSYDEFLLLAPVLQEIERLREQ